MSRIIDDLPPVASDEELMAWGQTLTELPERADLFDDEDATEPPVEPELRAERPLVADRSRTRMSDDEIFFDISERAAAAYQRRRVSVRRSALAGRTSTS